MSLSLSLARTFWLESADSNLQVLDGDLGWTGFRPYDSETWAWVSAALRPRFLLSSGSMSEASLVRVSGQMG